jgi:hypothetical protein
MTPFHEHAGSLRRRALSPSIFGESPPPSQPGHGPCGYGSLPDPACLEERGCCPGSRVHVPQPRTRVRSQVEDRWAVFPTACGSDTGGT